MFSNCFWSVSTFLRQTSRRVGEIWISKAIILDNVQLGFIPCCYTSISLTTPNKLQGVSLKKFIQDIINSNVDISMFSLDFYITFTGVLVSP